MKNLLTKTLLISLLLSTAMPSGAQVGSSTQDVNKFAEVVSALGVGVIAGAVVGSSNIVLGVVSEMLGDKTGKLATLALLLGGGAVGAAIGAAGAELKLGTEGVVAIGAGLGTIGGLAAATKGCSILLTILPTILPTMIGESVQTIMIFLIGPVVGAVGGARVGAAIVREIKAKYFSRRTAADEIIGRRQAEQKQAV